MSELEHAIRLANHVLERPSGDPDDDLAVLARQFLRARETLQSSQDASVSYQRGWDDGYSEGYACKLADATEPFTPTSTKPSEVMAAANYLRKKFSARFQTDAEAIGAARGMLQAIRALGETK